MRGASSAAPRLARGLSQTAEGGRDAPLREPRPRRDQCLRAVAFFRVAGLRRAVVFLRAVGLRAAVFFRAVVLRAVVFLLAAGLRAVVFLRAAGFLRAVVLRAAVLRAVLFGAAMLPPFGASGRLRTPCASGVGVPVRSSRPIRRNA